MKNKKNSGKKWYKQLAKNMRVKDSFSEAKDRFSCFLELPQEVVSKVTKLTSIENNNILIEGYKQIIDYYDDYIKIKANNMDILIDGKDLDIKEITDSDLVIEGNIYSVNYQR
jgi:sporulation protein YqfC